MNKQRTDGKTEKQFAELCLASSSTVHKKCFICFQRELGNLKKGGLHVQVLYLISQTDSFFIIVCLH